MHFDLTDLRLFLQVVEAGSITAGAARAGLALASASARVRGMEEQAGIALFDAICARDFRAENDLLPALGLGGLSPTELHRQLREG